MEMQVDAETKQFYRGMLEDAIQFCRIHADSCVKLSEEYRGLDMTRAHNQFALFLDQILTFLKFVDELSEFARLRLDGIVAQEEFLNSFYQLSEAIQRAGQAQSSEDWVLLADLLEYEFPQIFQVIVDSIDNQWTELEGQRAKAVN